MVAINEDDIFGTEDGIDNEENEDDIAGTEDKDDFEEANIKFKVGDTVQLLVLGAKPTKVVYVCHPMVTTMAGEFHHTKLVLRERAEA
jgi:hypothetical protein